jgi:hypothetical protein
MMNVIFPFTPEADHTSFPVVNRRTVGTLSEASYQVSHVPSCLAVHHLYRPDVCTLFIQIFLIIQECWL